MVNTIPCDLLDEAFAKFEIVDDSAKRCGLCLYLEGGIKAYEDQARLPQLFLVETVCEGGLDTPAGTSGAAPHSTVHTTST